MENEFWTQRIQNDEKQISIIQTHFPMETAHHSVTEYINGIQYVYACKCPQCLTLLPLKPKWSYTKSYGKERRFNNRFDECFNSPGKFSSPINCDYCRFSMCDVHIDNEEIVQNYQELIKTDSRNKFVYWKSKSRKRKERKQEQKLVCQLLAQHNLMQN